MLDWLRVIYDRLTAGGSTEAQAIKSGVWVTAINVGDRLLQLLKVVILARLLSPEAFGLLGIALVTVSALRQFSDLGFDQALIQHEEENVDTYLNTAWVIKIIRGSVIAVIAFLTAPYLAGFFGEPQAEPLIQLLGFTPLILGVQNPAVMYFQKHLNFHREFAYQVGGRLIDLLVATTIAVVFRSVWALPAGIMSMNLMKAALSYGIHEYRPRIEFNLNRGREMFSFGKWMFASSILVFLVNQGDDGFVGWFFTATTLGFYQIAYRFSNAPATEVTQVISRVSFPTFSKLQNDTERLRKGYFRAVQLSTVIGFPMAAGIAAVAPQFVQTVLGTQWAPMIPLMQVLAIWGGIRAFGANVGPIFKAIGRPDVEVKMQTVSLLIVLLLIYPFAVAFGVVGVAATIVVTSLIITPINQYLILSIINGNPRVLLRTVLYPLLGSILMFTVVRLVDMNLLQGRGLLELSALVAIGMISYLTIMLVFEKVSRFEFIALIRLIFGNL